VSREGPERRRARSSRPPTPKTASHPRAGLRRATLRQERGQAAEERVASFLVARGFELLGRNLRVGRFELDVVALKDRVVCVVEVRQRGAGAWQSALGSIDRRKRQRIRAAGQRLWRQHYRNDPRVDRLRFDAAAVYETGAGFEVEYIVAAF
jgi:putative endonuclease